ncbi:MAG: hypothetical protein A2087_12725 [Spirochaetes bacterium GWD1_61_31]|nr:MAG: hypothetical protein A2Y37_05765 [Spirochaetes bacterium GWB1_60_80]OHD34537.1 MAG: hypothetical protein A2004_08885 [Spirochaetes bacterium GWC1_61_12]OHD38141.1 MAG: hypothetical protein A2087_12725 [Spirochaetes bacterium GWD1_61_31]OHD42983.1 MAG: hypothetical protein A2Y35_14185 [Spirochaetes bacterium GWE1_60_18]OHD58709.1 MAG: hypothetical protein A2Y32_02090 [Spirochaetes bacterium GWF1_60_12]HAP44183.1 iron-sulfur cluster assembly scaffold protein [Spirochaetaceae bacterium]
MSGPVLYYTPQVIEHFSHPRNVGELSAADTDGYACIGDPGCGDELKLWLHVDQGRISAIRFKTFGCPGAIATSSMLTALAAGATIPEALAISDDDVVKALGGIPENKQHCSLLGVKALQAALLDWSRRQTVAAGA